MIQKLENTFFAILRAGVIFVAAAMVVAVVFFGVSAIPALGIYGDVKLEQPKVSAGDVTSLMLPKQSKAIQNISEKQAEPQEPQRDEDEVPVGKIVKSISRFIAENGGVPAEDAMIASVIHDQISVFDSDDLRSAYVNEFAGAIDQIFANGEVVAMAKNDVVATVKSVLTSYHAAFIKKAKDAERAMAIAESDAAKKKEEAQMAMYIAGASLFAFLIAACLLVIVRVERNTRATVA